MPLAQQPLAAGIRNTRHCFADATGDKTAQHAGQEHLAKLALRCALPGWDTAALIAVVDSLVSNESSIIQYWCRLFQEIAFVCISV